MPRVSAIAAFVVDVQNQQNHIAHQALFQRAGNSEGCSGIDNDSKKDTDVYDMELQADSWLSGILATEVMVLCLACFENQGQQRL